MGWSICAVCNEIGNVVLQLLQCTIRAYIHTCPVVYTRTYIDCLNFQ